MTSESETFQVCESCLVLDAHSLHKRRFRKTYGAMVRDEKICTICRAFCQAINLSSSGNIEPDCLLHTLPFFKSGDPQSALGIVSYREDEPAETLDSFESGLDLVERGIGGYMKPTFHGFLSVHKDHNQSLTSKRNRWSTRAVPLLEDLVLAKKHLKTCILKHKKCRPVFERPEAQVERVPKRLLRLGLVGTKYYAYLCEDYDREACQYTALSHCWGGGRPPKTTYSTIRQFETGVAVSSLPETFRDAIYITLTLDLCYIWIDSLCIVQDDRTDWRNQAPQMAVIYAQATFTIAASASSGPKGGCFRRQRPRRIFRVPIWNETSRSYVYSQVGLSPGTREECFSDFENEPLQKRAWAYQERVLSTRILFCTRLSYRWECRKESKIVQSVGTIIDDPFCPVPYEKNPHDQLLPRKSKRSDPRHDAARNWYKMISEYTKRNLTVQSDKLFAVAGLSRALAPLVKSEYVFGLWKDYLTDGLFWTSALQWEAKVDDNGDSANSALFESQTPITRAKEWRAPTWSWASVDGPLEWWNHFFQIPNDAIEDVRVECKELFAAMEASFPEGPPKSEIDGKILDSGFLAIDAIVTEIPVFIGERIDTRTTAEETGLPYWILQEEGPDLNDDQSWWVRLDVPSIVKNELSEGSQIVLASIRLGGWLILQWQPQIQAYHRVGIVIIHPSLVYDDEETLAICRSIVSKFGGADRKRTIWIA